MGHFGRVYPSEGVIYSHKGALYYCTMYMHSNKDEWLQGFTHASMSEWEQVADPTKIIGQIETKHHFNFASPSQYELYFKNI